MREHAQITAYRPTNEQKDAPAGRRRARRGSASTRTVPLPSIFEAAAEEEGQRRCRRGSPGHQGAGQVGDRAGGTGGRNIEVARLASGRAATAYTTACSPTLPHRLIAGREGDQERLLRQVADYRRIPIFDLEEFGENAGRSLPPSAAPGQHSLAEALLGQRLRRYGRAQGMPAATQQPSLRRWLAIVMWRWAEQRGRRPPDKTTDARTSWAGTTASGRRRDAGQYRRRRRLPKKVSTARPAPRQPSGPRRDPEAGRDDRRTADTGPGRPACR